MKHKLLTGLFIAILACSCTPHPAKSGLVIDNGINRGTTYTDTSGAAYNLRYIPVTITNDSTLPIQIDIAFSSEYRHHPDLDTRESFRLLPLPKKWAMDGLGVTDQMMEELPASIDQPVWHKTLQPGETCLLGIGTLYPRPTESSGILPNALFVLGNGNMFPECDRLDEADPSPSPDRTLMLSLKYSGKCMVIPCGRIWYPDP